MTQRSDGFALMLVIWSLVLLTSLATGFSYAVRHENRFAGDMAAIARADAASEAALRLAVLALESSDPETRWEADGQRRQIAWHDAKVSLRAYPENGRIDLNKAPRALLVGLFHEVLPDSEPDSLADAVLDWRDRDEQPRPAGAELRAYASAGYAYGPTNRLFTSVHELSQVIGFDRDQVVALIPYLTVYSRMAQVDAATAGATVLAAVPGISRAEADAYVTYREAALAAGDELSFHALQQGQRHLGTGNRQRTFSFETATRLADGTTRHEHLVVRIQPARGFDILARETLPAPEIEDNQSL